MFEFSFLSVEVFFAVFWVIFRLIRCIRSGTVDPKREAVLLLMAVNLAVIIRFAFFPMDRLDGQIQPLLFDSSALFPLRVNWVPFIKLLDYDNRRDLLLNLIGNVALFIPTGIILPILFRKRSSFWRVLASGVLISLGIEILQLPFAVRATDIDDLLMNAMGIAIGYGFYTLINTMCHRRRQLLFQRHPLKK